MSRDIITESDIDAARSWVKFVPPVARYGLYAFADLAAQSAGAAARGRGEACRPPYGLHDDRRSWWILGWLKDDAEAVER